MFARKASQNVLLDALPEEVWERLAPRLERVTMTTGQVLHEPGATLRDTYFPAGAVVSKVYMMESGASAQIALVGREGMVGVSLFLGGSSLLNQARVQSGGEGFRLPEQHLKSEFDRGGTMMQVLLLYTQALLAQMVLTAACNRHGTLEQRLCRWLLMSLDRSPDNQLTVTHEFISHVLGVRREGVTQAAGRLQDQGAIRYHRGHISVLDRLALERRVCECYSSPEHEAPAAGERRDACVATP